MTFVKLSSGWEYSVVSWGRGSKEGLLEIAIKKDGEWCGVRDTPIGDSMGHLTYEDVGVIISSMKEWKSDENFDDMERHAPLYDHLETILKRWGEEE
jgi:hypothetical protein|tara:strand:+ start:331 stop:621 length:291 start_codon:yes stop_codon:yes gene_type:complete